MQVDSRELSANDVRSLGAVASLRSEVDRNRTLSLGNLGKIEVPLPLLAAQQAFNQLQAQVAALKVKHAAIRQANAALIPATLERVFSTEAPAHA
jgi:hypothetical protein